MKADILATVIRTKDATFARQEEWNQPKKRKTDPDPEIVVENALDPLGEIVARCVLTKPERVGGKPIVNLQIIDRHHGNSPRPHQTMFEMSIGAMHTESDIMGRLDRDKIPGLIEQKINSRSKRPEQRVVRA